MVCPEFYHDNTDGHTNPCSSMDNPVVLFGVYHLPHQHHGLASAERYRQGKIQLDSANFRFSISARRPNNETYCRTDPRLTLTSTPKSGWHGKMKLR